MQLPFLGVVAVFARFALTAPDNGNASTPIRPTKDPWYTAPKNFDQAAPGEILRQRVAAGNLSAEYNSTETYQLLFRTTDSHYKPSWAVTTLLLPRNQAHALLSYQIPYNSVDLDASPSYSLYTTGNTGSEGSVKQDIVSGVQMGWAVNIPDFEGNLASFAAGVTEGHATIDSIRASLAFLRETKNGSPDIRVAMWGYSGGSIASEWAAELQVQYAPELDIAGTAIGGVVSNTSRALSDISGTMFAGLIPEGLLGITQQYPEARQYLLSQLKTSGPHNKTGFLAAEKLDINTAFGVYAGQNIWDYFIHGEDSIADSTALNKIFDREGVMGYHGVPQMPLFVYKAIHDEVTPIEDTDVLINRYCGVGANVVYQRNKVGGHLAELTNGDSYALDFLESVLDGHYSHVGCTIRDVVWNTTSSAI